MISFSLLLNQAFAVNNKSTRPSSIKCDTLKITMALLMTCRVLTP